MRPFRDIRDWVSGGLLLLGILSVVIALSVPRTPGDTDGAARHATKAITARIAQLDGYIDKALAQDPSGWLDLGNVPGDMVIYRYCQDTLQSWVNSFPQINDDIKEHSEFQNITSLRGSPMSPLVGVYDKLQFINLGPKWYLIKSRTDMPTRVIGALEVVDPIGSRRFNGVNPRLRIREKYSIKPLSENGGTAVELDGIPQFKVTYESLSGSSSADPTFIWMAVAFLIAAAIVFLSSRRTLRRLSIVSAGMLAVMASMYVWGRFAQWEMRLFSPTLFAGGEVLYSLGAVIIVNLTILLLSFFLFLAREDIYAHIRTRRATILLSVIATAVAAGILLYTYIAIKSIALNSNITLELYKFGELHFHSVLVYLSFLTMLISVPLLLQFLRPLFETLGLKANVLSRKGRVLASLFLAVYLVVPTSVLGLRKEQNRAEMWANRIAFDRDITLEMSLEGMEQQIANDAVISTLSVYENTAQTIQNRLANEHFFRIDQGYGVMVFILNRFNSSPQAVEYVNSRILGGEPISENSRFLYVNPPGGHSYYAGVFTYTVEGEGMATMLITIQSGLSKDIKGYQAILGAAPPGKVVLPAEYSYARYEGSALQMFKGGYAYSTTLDGQHLKMIYEDKMQSYKSSGYTHFINNINADECVIISRPTFSIINYILSTAILCLVFFFLLSFVNLPARRAQEKEFRKNYYKTRISAVLLASLTVTLVAMALASVLFVTSRNDSNRRSIMSEKIGAIGTMLESGTKQLPGRHFLLSPDFNNMLQTVAANTNSDITIFGRSGRVLTTTDPIMFERASLGSRIDSKAYDAIIRNSRRYFINKESVGSHEYYCMYAPIKDAGGEIIGIIGSPYTEETYDFERDAVTHSVTIITVFLLLLLLARVSVSSIVDRMFKPLVEMSRKMSATSLDSFELIEYDRDDEISSLVNAYNLMVTELSESSKKLAQAERDKAWSGMARQVAHEIKNPLTPMKLQLQRIIRLKAKGDPSWQDKFDEVTKVLLDHIDILSDTANEFSSFAKLYTEEPTVINLDKVLQEEISMFDNKGNVTFEYIGLSDVVIEGPKPQLTRVFVNLISNAVQAVGDAEDAHVFVALRNSVRDGYYDIVVEDNGPGVSEENVEKLFTPNFTTKSGGSGLGLAISRSVLERCNATISYSRSFTLGGACFTIQYPKNV